MKQILSYADTRKTAFRYTQESYDTYEGELFKKELFKFDDYRNFSAQPGELTEVLAPATKNTYKQAVYGGANAIYFGYGQFNARAGADNFDSIKEVVDFCHFYNVKAYLALNISFTNREIEKVKDIIIEAEEANIDAFIISDLALVSMIRKYSTASIHASTQLGAHNAWGIGFLKDMSFNRAVLSREMKFDDIKYVTDSQSIETEVFVHGALCSGFSGGCLLSSMLTGNSANRGKCNQLCRRYYKSLINGKPASRGYLLSAKDICLDEHISELVDIGVSSMKIEGRLKRAEYIGATSMYYSCLKVNWESAYSRQDLKILFNRGNFIQGYFEGDNVIYTGQPNHIGVYAGKIVHLITANKAYAMTESPLESDNGYKILRNNIEMGGAVATGEHKNGFSVIKSNVPLKVGDVIRLTGDSDLANFIIGKIKKKNVPISIRIASGEKPYIVLNILGNKYTYIGKEIVPMAINHPLTEEEIKDLFEGSRVREIKFIITDIQLYNAFLTKAQLNALRRDILDTIWRFLLGYYERTKKLFNEKPIPVFEKSVTEFVDGSFCEVECLQKVEKIEKYINNIVYNPYNYSKEKCLEFYNKTKKFNNKIFIKLPIYVPTSKEDFFEEIVKIFDGVLANNIGACFVARKYQKLLVCGQNMNIMNTKNWLIKNCCSYIVSPELNYSDVKKFKNPLIYAYGKLPLMYLNYCPRRLVGMECGECDAELKFTDERGEYLITTQKFSGYCEHTLHNDRLTDIGNVYNKSRWYFDFTLTDGNEAERILALYFGENDYQPKNTNKLHLTRGVD